MSGTGRGRLMETDATPERIGRRYVTSTAERRPLVRHVHIFQTNFVLYPLDKRNFCARRLPHVPHISSLSLHLPTTTRQHHDYLLFLLHRNTLLSRLCWPDSCGVPCTSALIRKRYDPLFRNDATIQINRVPICLPPPPMSTVRSERNPCHCNSMRKWWCRWGC